MSKPTNTKRKKGASAPKPYAEAVDAALTLRVSKELLAKIDTKVEALNAQKKATGRAMRTSSTYSNPRPMTCAGEVVGAESGRYYVAPWSASRRFYESRRLAHPPRRRSSIRCAACAETPLAELARW